MTPDIALDQQRRRFLQSVTGIGAVGLAGCLGDDDDEADDTDDADDADDRDDADVETGAIFEITSVDPTEKEIEYGDVFTIALEVRNVGDAEGMQTVECRIENEEISSVPVRLDPDEQQTVSFTDIETAPFGEGTFEITLRTEDDERTATLTIVRTRADLIEFSAAISEVPNGAWTWFTDERCIVDPNENRLLVGSVSANGDASGDIVLLWYDLDTDDIGHYILHEGLDQDDHAVPALYLRSDGRYLAMYSMTGSNPYTRWRISEEPHDPTSWSEEQTFENQRGVQYNNLYRLAEDRDGDGRMYDIVRSENWDPNILVSTDEGSSWEWGGRMLARGGGGDRPYYRFAGDDKRLHMTIVPEHPRNNVDNSLYHAYIEDGAMYGSDGASIEENLLDRTSDAPDPEALTLVFESGTEVNGTEMTRCWNIDTSLDDAGNPVAVFITRAEDEMTDHRFFYTTYDGTTWKSHEVTPAGENLYDAEEDYTGLAAIDPNDPSRVVYATHIDPRDGADLDHHELFLGETPDAGENWEWTALTPRATADNLRPLIPDWSDDQSGLVWMQGEYHSWTSWDSQVVGIADHIAPVKIEGLLLSDLDPADAQLESGESLEVSATVENIGTAAIDTSVAYRIGDHEVGTSELSLEENTTETVSFETFYDDVSAELADGQYTHGMYADDEHIEGQFILGAVDELLIDNFERGNLDPYEGAVNDFSITDDNPIAGTYSLLFPAASSDVIIGSNTGLPTYPDIGDTHRFDIRLTDDVDTAGMGVLFGSSNPAVREDGYQALIMRDTVMIRRMDDGDEVALESGDVSLGEGERYTGEVTHTSTGEITLRVLTEDEEELASISATDDTYLDGDTYTFSGIGIFNFRESTVLMDNWRIVESS